MQPQAHARRSKVPWAAVVLSTLRKVASFLEQTDGRLSKHAISLVQDSFMPCRPAIARHADVWFEVPDNDVLHFPAPLQATGTVTYSRQEPITESLPSAQSLAWPLINAPALHQMTPALPTFPKSSIVLGRFPSRFSRQTPPARTVPSR